jgi:hypothetical protein
MKRVETEGKGMNCWISLAWEILGRKHDENLIKKSRQIHFLPRNLMHTTSTSSQSPLPALLNCLPLVLSLFFCALPLPYLYFCPKYSISRLLISFISEYKGGSC